MFVTAQGHRPEGSKGKKVAASPCCVSLGIISQEQKLSESSSPDLTVYIQLVTKPASIILSPGLYANLSIPSTNTLCQ